MRLPQPFHTWGCRYFRRRCGNEFKWFYNFRRRVSLCVLLCRPIRLLFTDANLNVNTGIAYVDRDVWLPQAVYGQKLNADGSLAFQPLTTGIDVLDGVSGLLDYRVGLSIEPANVYDALAVDDPDKLIFAITTNGIAAVDLSALPVPLSRRKHPAPQTSSGVAQQSRSQSRTMVRSRISADPTRPRLKYVQSAKAKH
jgi:hypothetical protein